MNKIIIVFVCACIGCFVGLACYKQHKARRLYYAEINMFLDTLIADVRYRQDGIICLLQEARSISKTEFKAHIDMFLSGRTTSIASKSLKKQELYNIKRFFDTIGKADSSTELMVLSGYKQEFDTLASTYKTVFDKRASMCIKLGVLIGIGVGIIIM